MYDHVMKTAFSFISKEIKLRSINISIERDGCMTRSFNDKSLVFRKSLNLLSLLNCNIDKKYFDFHMYTQQMI